MAMAIARDVGRAANGGVAVAREEDATCKGDVSGGRAGAAQGERKGERKRDMANLIGTRHRPHGRAGGAIREARKTQSKTGSTPIRHDCTSVEVR
jgi:hypothetical protein